MKRNLFRVVLACAAGAFIGSLLAMQIAHRFEIGKYFVWIGMVVGGLFAYVTIDFRQFAAGVRHAYETAVGWKPNTGWWKIALGLPTAISVVIGPWIAAGLYASLRHAENPLTPQHAVLATSIVTFTFVTLMTVLAYDGSRWESKADMTAEIKRVIVWYNPIGLALLTPGWVTRTILKIPGITKTSWSTSWAFVRKTFINVHHSRRAICFIAAGIGAGIGWYYNNALIGIAAGALIGLLEHEIIAIRWLKLVPNGATISR